MKKLFLPFLVSTVISYNIFFKMSTSWSVTTNRLESTATKTTSKFSNSTKTILIWNPYSRFELEVFGEGYDTFKRHNCPINDCLITKNKSYSAMEDFDAVIFNMPSLSIYKFPLNQHRRAEQRYIFFTQESAAYIAEEVHQFNHLFNWTMTYDTRSDIPYIYGEVSPLSSISSMPSQPRPVGPENYALGKTKLVAWFTSHCLTQSKRERYVSVLRKHIDVDIYGGCYTLKCSMNSSSFTSQSHCYDMLERDYKFYLSFENSLCSDYVTEKFFDILRRNVIPVVMGGANYSALAPPHSYIDAVRYSPRQLAAYLKMLASDDRLYNEYFWWKPFFKVESRYPVMENRALCQLCEKLHFDKQVSVYDDLSPLWSKNARCQNPKFKEVHIFWNLF